MFRILLPLLISGSAYAVEKYGFKTFEEIHNNSVSCDQNKDALSIEEWTNKLSQHLNCQLVPTTPAPHKIVGLSAYWAQEYTGTDLVRERLKSSVIEPGLIEVWDSNEHGESVSNLIAGQKPSALIPSNSNPAIRYVDGIFNPEAAHLKAASECLTEKNCGKYINNSIEWRDSKLVAEAIEKVSEHSVFITANGNEGNLTENAKRVIATNHKVIMVSSLAPDGTGSSFTNFAPETTISAPSDNSLLSYIGDEPVKFGGTSGAAPQVTAALASFTVLTGYQLNTSESKFLLGKTALPFPNYPAPNSLGSGMLNSYKIAEVAIRLKEKCKNNKECFKKSLADEKTYNISINAPQVIKEAQKGFPECTDGLEKTSSSTCEEKKLILKNLRKAAFLDHSNPSLWKFISCISKNDGMTKNSEFYESMAKRQGKSDSDLIAEIKQKKDAARHLLYLYSAKPWNKNHHWVEELAKNTEKDLEVIKLLASNPESVQISHVLDPIIGRDTFSKTIINNLLTSPEWSTRDDIVIKLIKSEEYQDSLIRVLGMDHWVQPKLMNQIIQEQEWPVLRKIIERVLSRQPAWSQHTEIIDELVKKNIPALNMEIEELLAKPHWQKAYQKKLNLQREVTLADIQKS
ncbi:MAG: S8 family serine peptidase [Bacteriovoracaceae bacterium]